MKLTKKNHSRYLRNFSWIFPIAFVLTLGQTFRSSAQGAESLGLTTCRTGGVARLHQSENCRAELEVSGLSLASTEKFCIPKDLWLRMLQSNDSKPCGIWFGKWKSTTRTQNFPGLEYKIPHKRFLVHRFSIPLAQPMPKILSVEKPNWPFWYKARQSLERLREKLSICLAPVDPWGILRTLVLSETPSPSQAPDPGILRLLGFVHLLNVSGIHLYAVSRFWNHRLRSLAQGLRIPVNRGLWLARFIVCSQLIFCWALSGFRLGILRPWIVITLRALSLHFGFRWRKAAPLGVMLLIETAAVFFFQYRLHAPMSSLDHESLRQLLSGHLLYALAVGGGLIAQEKGWRGHLALAISSWIFSALWECWFEGATSVITPLLSLITIPLLSGLIYPLSIFLAYRLMINLAQGVQFKLILLLLKATTTVTSWLTGWALASPGIWTCSRPALVFGLFLTLLSMSTRHWGNEKIFRAPRIVLGVFFLLSLFGFRSISPGAAQGPPDPATHAKAQFIQQIDVGQGDAALVVSKEAGAGLVDTGNSLALKDSEWLQIFFRQKIHHLDWVFISHLDQDHSGGLARLARIIPVRCAIVSSQELQSERGPAFAERMHSLGIRLTDENSACVPFAVRSPSPSQKIKGKTRHIANSGMLSIWIPLEKGGFYFAAGDATQEEEKKMIPWLKQKIEIVETPRILKVGHHGSQSSSAPEFLLALQPTQAWLSVGEGNTYGHPAIQTLDRLLQLRIPPLRTDIQGALFYDSKKVTNPYNFK